MPPKPLTLIACSVFKPEISALTGRGIISVPVQYLDSALHMQPESLHENLREAVQKERAAGFRTLLIYGDCSTRVDELVNGTDVARLTGANCGEILLGKEHHKSLIKQGAFLLFPEWAQRWKEILSQFPGVDTETARKMMQDMHTRFVYLDTGVRSVPHTALKECSEFFGLPCEVADVGLAHFQQAILNLINAHTGPAPAGMPFSPDRNATAVMMLDIIAAVLKHPDRIPETAALLSQKIRELTGARLVILAVADAPEPPGYRILDANPARHTALVETEPVRKLIEASFRMDRATLLPATNTDSGETTAAGFDAHPCLIIPLKSSEERIGAILSLGLMDESFVQSILEIQDVLSNSVSVVLKNALLMERQKLTLEDLEHEIAERTQAEEELRESRETLQAFFDAVQEGMVLIDRHGVVRLSNVVSSQRLGVPATEFVGTVLYDHYPPEVTARRKPQYDRVFTTGKPVFFQDSRHGRVYSQSCYPVFDRQGTTVAAALFYQDITEQKKAEENLRESEQRFRALVETTSDWVWEIDEHNRFTYASPKVEELLGYLPEEIIGRTPFEFIFPDKVEEVVAQFRDILKDRRPFTALENVNQHKDGWQVILETSGVPFFDRNDRFAGYRGIDRDITLRKRAEEALAAERQRLAYILEGTNAGTWEWNVQTGETVFNERWAETIGYTLKELAPVSIETWTTFAHPEDLQRSDDLLKRHFAQELPYYECEVRMRHKDGSWVWVLDRGKVATWTGDGKPLVMSGTHQDITARKQAEEQIRHLANHDALTGLPTLRLARERLSLALGLARRHQTITAVMFLDLDGFKEINDTLGHEAGDEALKHVGESLLSCVRETDTVARIGGDEFLLVASGLSSAADAAQVAEKALHTVSTPFTVQGRGMTIGASIGIALFPRDGSQTDDLIRRADKAMFAGKNAGKNRYVFADAPA